MDFQDSSCDWGGRVDGMHRNAIFYILLYQILAPKAHIVRSNDKIPETSDCAEYTGSSVYERNW